MTQKQSRIRRIEEGLEAIATNEGGVSVFLRAPEAENKSKTCKIRDIRFPTFEPLYDPTPKELPILYISTRVTNHPFGYLNTMFYLLLNDELGYNFDGRTIMKRVCFQSFSHLSEIKHTYMTYSNFGNYLKSNTRLVPKVYNFVRMMLKENQMFLPLNNPHLF